MNKKTLATIFALAFISVTSYPAFLRAEPDRLVSDRSFLTAFNPPKQPPRGAPRGRGRGAASRPGDKNAQCPEVNTPLVALVPNKQKEEKGIWGLATDERPTLWFYVPYSSKQVNSATFYLTDESDNYVQEPIEISLPENPGVVGIRLPASSGPLATDNAYDWKFTIFCSEDKKVRVSVNGVIEREVPSAKLRQDLETSKEGEEYRAYSDNGFWYDAITNLAEMRLANPDDVELTAAWQELLKHENVGLGEVASEPIVLYERFEGASQTVETIATQAQ